MNIQNDIKFGVCPCLGYAILGAKNLGMDDKQIKKMVRSIYGEFDTKSVPEAEDVYRESEY